MELPDGLAYGRLRTLTVRTKDMRTGEAEPLVTFTYYLEYGLDCAVRIRTEGDMVDYFLPVQAMLEFSDHFRKEIEDAKR